MQTNYRILTISLALFALLLISAPANAQVSDDTDGDGLSNSLETEVYHTAINNPDTDGDGYDDLQEVERGYSPLHPNLKFGTVDSDRDGLSDLWEIRIGTNITKADTDADGFSDYQEVYAGFSPTDAKNVKVKKKITVDIKNFSLKYYFDDKLLGSAIVSTGRRGWLTPTGNFTVLDKVPSKNYGGGPYSFYYPNTKWNLHFTTGNNKLRYFIHGAYWHNDFGKKNVSSGCVNVRYADMEPLYRFAQVGTKIEIK